MKIAFHFAMKRALENNSDSSTNNDFEDEANDYMILTNQKLQLILVLMLSWILNKSS